MAEHFVVETNRIQKAEKIRLILEDYMQAPLEGYTLLDIGCGSGLIAYSLAAYGNKLTAVDVSDQRDPAYSNKYDFVKVESEKLPFANDSFDIVLSNHVIEHVNNHNEHLAEIARVLKPGGLCYFATPNRYFPYEVHYKVPFIHWLPAGLFDKTLKMLGKYSDPVRLKSYWGLRKLCKPYFMMFEYTHKVIKQPQKFAFNALPKWFSCLYITKLNFISPTMIYVLKKKTSA